MDQEPSSSGSGGKPGIFQKLNTTIAGITGLLIALGGLTAATKGVLWDKKPAEEKAVASAPAQLSAANQPPAEAPRTTLYKGDLYNDDGERFDGGSMQLEHNGERWILTIAGDDEKYKYDQLSTNDKDQLVATSPDYTSTLRWPVKGGIVEESTKASRDKWETYGKVEAATPAQ